MSLCSSISWGQHQQRLWRSSMANITEVLQVSVVARATEILRDKGCWIHLAFLCPQEEVQPMGFLLVPHLVCWHSEKQQSQGPKIMCTRNFQCLGSGVQVHLSQWHWCLRYRMWRFLMEKESGSLGLTVVTSARDWCHCSLGPQWQLHPSESMYQLGLQAALATGISFCEDLGDLESKGYQWPKGWDFLGSSCSPFPNGKKFLWGEHTSPPPGAKLFWAERWVDVDKILPILFCVVVLSFWALQDFFMLLHCSPKLSLSYFHGFEVGCLTFLLYFWGRWALRPPTSPFCWQHLL